jgi:hypothetical protein
MEDRDQKILTHIGLYRLSIRAVIEHLYFEGKTSDRVLSRLMKDEKLHRSENAFPGGISYYQLKLSEARNGPASVPENRARTQGARAVRQALAALWFCCMTEKKRQKLDTAKIIKLYQKDIIRPHCAEVSPQGNMLYSLYVPGPNSRDDYLPKRLQHDIQAISAFPQLGTLLKLKKMGFAVLVETEQRKEKLARILRRQAPDAAVLIEVVPGPNTLQTAIKDFQKKHPAKWYNAQRP